MVQKVIKYETNKAFKGSCQRAFSLNINKNILTHILLHLNPFRNERFYQLLFSYISSDDFKLMYGKSKNVIYLFILFKIGLI